MTQRNFLKDFINCPGIKTRGSFEAKFQIANGVAVEKDGLMIASSIRQEYAGKNYDDKYMATLDIDSTLSPTILHVVKLIQKYAVAATEVDELPLVLCGSFRFGKEVQSVYESYHPIKPVTLESLIIAYYKVPFLEVKKYEEEIIKRLKRYIMASV